MKQKARAPKETSHDAFTVAEFCRRHRICKQTYYNLRNRGEGPTEMTIGRAVRISVEAAEQWRREREAAAA